MTALDSVTKLAIAELSIYILLLPVVIFILVRHGKPGIFGWLFLSIFCVLRIVSSGLQISDGIQASDGKPTSVTATIVNSVGVSPLLMALSGILSEASHYASSINRKLNIAMHLLVHQAIVVGIILAAIGGSNLAKPASSSNSLSTAATLVKVGYIILFLVVVKLAINALFVQKHLSRSTENQNMRTGILPLVYWTLIAIVFVAVRVIYGLVFAFDRSPKLSPYSGSFAVKFVLIFLVQLIAALCLVVGGLVTKNIK